MRSSLSIVGVSLALLAVPTAAAGDSIVYVGSDRNVHLVSPDGAVHHQVTRRPNAEFRWPSQDDSGMIIAPLAGQSPERLKPSDGSYAAGLLYWSRNIGTSVSSYPIRAQVSPGGALVVYDVVDPSARDYLAVSVMNATGITRHCATYVCSEGYWKPRWIPGTEKIGMLSLDGELVLRDGTGVHDWLTANGGEFTSFDVSRTGNKVLLTGLYDRVTSLLVVRNDGPPPGAGAEVECDIEGFTGEVPRWSPDGTRIAWSDRQGVWVSPAPAAPGCALVPRLVAPGGMEADWGPANVPGTPVAASPSPSPTSLSPSPPPSAPADTIAPGLAVTVPKTVKRAALHRRGLTLPIRCSEACTVTAELRLKQRKLATATATAPGRLRFKRLRVKAGQRLTIKLTAVDAAGNRSAALTRTLRVQR